MILFLHKVLVFLIPILPFLILCSISIFIDTITGVFFAIRKKIFSSKLFINFLIKLIAYNIGLGFVYFLDIYVLHAILSLIILSPAELISTKIATICVIFIELSSANRNIFLLTKFDLFGKIKEFFSKTIKLKEDITKLKE